MIELNKIYNEDCLETMGRMEDKSVDLILTDPPYGVGIDYGGFVDTRENVRLLVSRVFPEMVRVAKRVVVSCGIGNVTAYPEADWMICWYYSPGHSYCPWGFNSWQPILVYGKDPYLQNKMGCREDVVKKTQTGADKGGHPVAKDVTDWNRMLMRVSVDRAEVVYDPFLGSGTTALSAINTGHPWIGSEINPDYCKIAQKRIDAVLAQGNLFDQGAG